MTEVLVQKRGGSKGEKDEQIFKILLVDKADLDSEREEMIEASFFFLIKKKTPPLQKKPQTHNISTSVGTAIF